MARIEVKAGEVRPYVVIAADGRVLDAFKVRWLADMRAQKENIRK